MVAADAQDATQVAKAVALVGRLGQLAQQLGLTGTPAFVIGDTILRGAPRTADDLRALLKPKS